MGNIYMSPPFSPVTCRLDCIMNRVIFYCDMAMTPIIQILSCSDVPIWFMGGDSQFYWFLADNGLLVKIACASLESSVDTNIHAFISCKDVENLQKVECGSIPQQRYQLSCQKSIHKQHHANRQNEFPVHPRNRRGVAQPNQVRSLLRIRKNPFSSLQLECSHPSAVT